MINVNSKLFWYILVFFLNMVCKNVKKIKEIVIGYIVIKIGIDILMSCVNFIFVISVLNIVKIIVIFLYEMFGNNLWKKEEYVVISLIFVVRYVIVIIKFKKMEL